MEENKSIMNMSAEREISLKELFWKILYSWRMLIVCAVAFAILLGGYSYIKSRQAVASQQAQSKLTVEEMEKRLTKEEQKGMQQAKALQQQIDAKEKYLQESVLMNLNPYQLEKKTIQYYVDTNYTWSLNSVNEEDYAQEVIDGYVSYIQNQEILTDIKDVVKWEEEDAYIGELINAKRVNLVANKETGKISASFTVEIMGQDKEQIDMLTDAVIAAMKDYQTVLSKKIGTHDLVQVDVYESVYIDKELATAQEEFDKTITALQTQLNTVTAELTPAQTQVLEGMKNTEETTEQAALPKPAVSMKYLVLGIFVGIFLAALWIIVSYIFNNKIKNVNEVQELYGIRLFGSIELEDSGKKKAFSGIDKFLEKLRGKEQLSWEDQRELILTNLIVTLKKEKLDRVLLTTSMYFTEEEKERVSYFVERLKEEQIEAVFAVDMIRNARTFEQMSEIENVVLVECLEQTTYEAVEKQLVLCKEQGAKILGVIVFE